jgi:hypothetical protein
VSDKINIIVERDGEFHKFKFGSGDCNDCSLEMRGDGAFDACDVCMALEGHFEKVIMKGEKEK